MNKILLRWFVAQLETKCPDGCDNGTVPNTEALASFDKTLKEMGGRNWNRGAFAEASAAAPAATAPCPGCEGRGTVLTDAGRAAFDFLTRHQSGAGS